VSATIAPTRPTWGSLAADRLVVELKEFSRSREQMIFIFAFPLIFMVLFGSMLGAQTVGDTDVTFAQYFMAGMIATGIINTGFQSLALSIAIDRDEDVLKRIHGTPLPPTAFFAGKIAQVLVVSVIQLALLIAVGVAFYGVDLPADAGHWWTFTWVFLLGTGASTTLGIAASSLLRNAKAGSAILTPVILFLQFTSGVFFVYTQVPRWLQHIAELFPLKWLAQGMRSVFLPEDFQYAEQAGSWQHPLTALVLAVWFIVGLIVATRTFRWQRADDR
jgi:ABC-2 type transport system permease protein